VGNRTLNKLLCLFPHKGSFQDAIIQMTEKYPERRAKISPTCGFLRFLFPKSEIAYTLLPQVSLPPLGNLDYNKHY
jgi:hypothetical protein